MKFKDWLKSYTNVTFDDVRTYDDYVYSLFDVVTGEYGFPIISKNDGCLLRELLGCIKKDDNKLSDLKLLKIGTFNRETGIVQPLNHTTVVENMFDYINEGAN